MINFKDLIIKKFIPIAKLIFIYAYLHFFFKGGRGSTKSSFIALVLVVLMVQDKTFNAVCIRSNLYGGVQAGSGLASALLGTDGIASLASMAAGGV